MWFLSASSSRRLSNTRNPKKTQFLNENKDTRDEDQDHPNLDQTAPILRLGGPQLHSIAASMISTFSDAHLTPVGWKNEEQPRITTSLN